jgi:hypothetical protein
MRGRVAGKNCRISSGKLLWDGAFYMLFASPCSENISRNKAFFE